MMFKGIDTASHISKTAAEKLKSLGFSFVGRYIVPEEGSTRWKALGFDESRDILDSGLAILPIWETTGSRAKGGVSAGAADGYSAMKRAEELGIPAGTTIYFAVDYDAPEKDYAVIEAYLRGAKWNVEQYKIGLYAPSRVLPEMIGVIDHGWQAYAWAYGFKAETDVYQTAYQDSPASREIQKVTGFAVDLDEAKSLESMWTAVDPGDEAVQWAKKLGIITEDTPNMKEIALMLYRYHKAFAKE